MKYSKKELKHQCDNCCCTDCHQTKSLLFVDDELFNQKSIKLNNVLFDKYYSTMQKRFYNNNGIVYILRSRCKVNRKGEIINVEILGEYKNDK